MGEFFMTKISNSFKISENLDDLKISFAQSAKDKMDYIEELLLRLGDSNTYEEYEQTINKVLMEIHSTKGTAKACGMPQVSNLCHQYENLLCSFLKQSPSDNREGIENMLEYVDALEFYFAEYLKNKFVDDDNFLNKYSHLFNISTCSPSSKSLNQEKALNILIVGLRKTIIKRIDLALKGQAHSISYVEDPIEAIHKIARESFDLVLSSYAMTPINGVSFSAAIKTQWGEKSPKIVVFSAEKVKDLNYKKILPDHFILKSQELSNELREYLHNEFQLKKIQKKVRSVYFIDDDENILSLISIILEEKKDILSYTSPTLTNPLNNLITTRPDLIVSDINVPQVNVVELLNAIREI